MANTPETQSTDIEKNDKDPYAYLERDAFTSEKYKIEIRGLPKYYGIGEFKKLLNEKLELQSCKVKPPRKGSGWVYVCFRNEECRQRAISTINGILWKNSKLTAQVFSMFSCKITVSYKIMVRYCSDYCFLFR